MPSLVGLTGNATADLGLGGSLQQQVAGETEEEKRKRLAAMQAQRYSGLGASPAAQMLLGGAGAAGGY
jgi:hypothetical protein